MGHPVWRSFWRQRVLRHVLADVLGENLVDQRLVADAPAARFLTELIEDAWIDTDRDQLTRFVTEWGPTHPSHGLQLRGRRIGYVGKVNLSRRTPRAPGDSRAVR
jgi:hypothetical protein